MSNSAYWTFDEDGNVRSVEQGAADDDSIEQQQTVDERPGSR